MIVHLQLGDGAIKNLEIEGHHTVAHIREMVAALTAVHPEHQRLILAAAEGGRATELLDDTKTAAEHGFASQANLRLGERPLPKIVMLDVGGVKHTTLLSTLREVEGSRLEKMFDGVGMSVEGEGMPGGEMSTVYVPRDRDGSYVINRNGAVFGYVLDYLRDREAARADGAGGGLEGGALELILPLGREELQRLGREAAWYGLPDLVVACQKAQDQLKADARAQNEAQATAQRQAQAQVDALATAVAAPATSEYGVVLGKSKRFCFETAGAQENIPVVANLAAAVTQKLAEGWRLQGGIACIDHPHVGRVQAQAMVR